MAQCTQVKLNGLSLLFKSKVSEKKAKFSKLFLTTRSTINFCMENRLVASLLSTWSTHSSGALSINEHSKQISDVWHFAAYIFYWNTYLVAVHSHNTTDRVQNIDNTQQIAWMRRVHSTNEKYFTHTHTPIDTERITK